ncbi:PIR Superfamily Protein [Plasmodium ovale curtisi]|uniref:PIR Superfamily Protein n=1 Tax=Plasmodium ovale curtisi TaxID=864141 RepID=A0A1A8XBX9_PLAOA|nr:PIR Superfamily Protein [Plasmodium ovale curtisi]SBT02712.1 PIR Superfamily Protein [Plasmodium ovale curtisi]
MDHVEPFLEHFTSRKLYDEMNREDVSNEDFAYCNTMKAQFPEYNGFYKRCGIFVRNLKDFSKIMEYESNDNERCRFFYFWIHNELRKKLSNYKDNSEKNTHLVRAFFTVWNRVNKETTKNNCKSVYNYHVKIHEDYKNNCCKNDTSRCSSYHDINEWCKDERFLTKLDCEEYEVPVVISPGGVESNFTREELGN